MAGKKYWKISHVVMVITSSRRTGVINPIFSQVMTITTSDIFQYFCQPCNNHIHRLVVKWPQSWIFFAIQYCTESKSHSSLHSKNREISTIIFVSPLGKDLHFLFMNDIWRFVTWNKETIKNTRFWSSEINLKLYHYMIDYWDFRYWGTFLGLIIPIIKDPLYWEQMIRSMICVKFFW